jgi:hypothetical protein
MYYRRAREVACRTAAAQFPILLITGPRQVGKTSLLEHLRESERSYVPLDDMNLRALAKSDPPLLLQRFPPPVLIDEVQYAPELFPAIKMQADRSPTPGGFWLTGSQSFPLTKGVSESLSGRVAILNLLGFSAREADRRVSDVPPFLPGGEAVAKRGASGASTTLASVYDRIWRGRFPALVTGEVRNRDLFYRSYVQTYLQRDVRDLLKVGDLNLFMRFLKAAAARTGQLLNAHDGGLHPVAVKKAASVGREDARAFALLAQRGATAGAGAVLSLSADSLPLDRTTVNLLIGWL